MGAKMLKSNNPLIPNQASECINNFLKSTPIIKNKSLTILLVEDNILDAELTREAIESIDIKSHIIETTDGVDALICFEDLNDKALQLPDVILLDLGLPHLDGFKVLAKINHDKKLKNIPIIILTGTSNNSYIQHYYKDLKVIDYIVKPCTPENLSVAFTKMPESISEQDPHTQSFMGFKI
ncbi:MAG: CheY-like chemotaxis protein [Alphaproteobacteria bacterium]|jgi:CheY-like chemotaxis protein